MTENIVDPFIFHVIRERLTEPEVADPDLILYKINSDANFLPLLKIIIVNALKCNQIKLYSLKELCKRKTLFCKILIGWFSQ